MTCEYCGNQIPDDVSSCPACGATVQRKAPVSEPAPKVQASSGAEATEQKKEDDPATSIGAAAVCFIIGIGLICFCEEWYLRFAGGPFFIVIGGMCLADLFKKKKQNGGSAE